MAFDKKAVHFGGGNIGRGFVAEFLHNAGYEVVFVDVMDSIIEALQKAPSYTVTEIGEDGERTFTIDHYRAINSKYELEKVVDEIATADVVTCAVGPNILKFVAEPVAKAIEKRARYANSAIDRIVPQQDADAGLNVKIEKFYEWCVEQKPFENGGKKPDIKGVHYVDDLQPYIERKLFTVNTSHATAAYYGHNRGKAFIHEALHDKEIHDIVRDVVKETAHLIVQKHGISVKEQDDYVESIITRISNPTLKDNVERVGRAPLRKLSRNERFIGPAAHLVERGDKVDALLGAIEVALKFQNVEGDEESVELAKILKENSAEDATTKITGLDTSHGLYAQIVPIVKKVQGSSSL